MKVAVTNYTGTVGKTTISALLLAPRMNLDMIFAVETINETAESFGITVEKMSGEDFRPLFKKLVMLDDAIIDVGASNVEGFLNGLVRFEDSHLEIDYFIVPVTPGTKEMKETMAVITAMQELGVPAEKIRIVFNRVQDDVAEEFGPLLQFAKKMKNCVANPEAAIYENEVFDLMAVRKVSMNEMLNDDTDYKAKARQIKAENGDMKLADRYTDLLSIRLGIKPLNRNLDAVFDVLFK